MELVRKNVSFYPNSSSKDDKNIKNSQTSEYDFPQNINLDFTFNENRKYCYIFEIAYCLKPNIIIPKLYA